MLWTLSDDGVMAQDTNTNTTSTTPAVARLAMMTLDCADTEALSTFWSAVLGWEVTASGEGYAMLGAPGGGPALGVGQVEGYVAPGWPNEHGSKQYHFDLAVADIEAAATRCVELGATRPHDQPGDGRWVVLLDPAGHTFCLTDEQNW